MKGVHCQTSASRIAGYTKRGLIVHRITRLAG